MLSGRLDRRIGLYTLSVGQDSYGGKTESWNLLDTVWAQALPIRGQEFIEAAQFVAGAEIKFRIRYRNDIDEKARIVFDGVDYDILYIAELGRREGLEILAKKP